MTVIGPVRGWTSRSSPTVRAVPSYPDGMARWWMRVIVGVIVLAGAGAGAAMPAVADAAWDPIVFDCLGHPVVRPSEIVMTCADANDEILNIRWQSWGAGSANGTGTEHANQCVPDCADGKWAVFPVRLGLSQPVNGAFSLMALTPVATGNTQYLQLRTS
ncbi:hypothetical protein HH308_11670 [Gordonia sp. TBRC 11910]|uniref:Secreted protein n=1 Tax=Gordonia asplenii TaxID=2725283 RepID=A0A848KUG8_9ACTN|nr:hypothetical protein [Gordonia asplenii]NMO01869.1 hypothetical protein [Gordonia asplenii]